MDRWDWAMALAVWPTPGVLWITTDGATEGSPDEISLGRKGHDLVLDLICCVAFGKSLSPSGPPVETG